MNRTSTRRLAALTASAALVGGGLAALPATASASPLAQATAPTSTSPTAAAAPVAVDDVDLTWQLNREAVSGAFAPGTWNLFSAGKVGDPGAGGQSLRLADEGATWGNGADAGWSATDGDVVVEDLAADGSYAPTTFEGTRRNTAGVLSTPVGNPNVTSENRVVFGAGTGTVDPAAGTAEITWDGDLSVLFYSGMTFFYLSDPALSVAADGTAELTATVGGYATSMDDMDQWEPLADREVVLADLEGVEIDTDGFTVTPDYLGVAYDAGEGATPQARTGASWGSFPQSFVDFAQVTGAGSYWYSSGGAADPRKPAAPLSVSWDVPPQPRLTVSATTLLPDGAQQVTVEGRGFDPDAVPATRAPLSGSSGGVYVAFGSYDDVWQPSAGAPPAARRNVSTATRWAVLAKDMATVGGAPRGAIELSESGTFSTTLTIDKADADALGAGRHGIYTYPGGGAVEPLFETATPLTFEAAAGTVGLSAPASTFGRAARVTATVSGPTSPRGAVTLRRAGSVVGTAQVDGDGRAVFTLPRNLGAGSHALSASYAGDVNLAAAARSATLRVSKATSRVSTGVTRLPRPGRAGTARVTASSPSGASLTGRPTVVLRTAGGRQVRTWRPTLRSGTATFALPRLPVGRYRLVTAWPGNANHLRAPATTRQFGVRR